MSVGQKTSFQCIYFDFFISTSNKTSSDETDGRWMNMRRYDYELRIHNQCELFSYEVTCIKN
jgi:hypothetical protein